MPTKSFSKNEGSFAKSIYQWLEAPNAPLTIQKAHQLIQLERDWIHTLKALSQSPFANTATNKLPRVADFAGSDLVVFASTSAARAKTMLYAQAIVEALRIKGWQISRILVRVQESQAAQQQQPERQKRTISGQAASELLQAANAIQHKTLKHALKRISDNASQEKMN
jgi:hypothetical protein